MWRTREDCILDESGLQSLPTSVSGDLGPGGSSLIDRKFSIVSLPSTSFSHLSIDALDDVDEEPETALPDKVLLSDALKEAERMIKTAERDGSRSDLKKAKERRSDIIRLMRVELIYVRDITCFTAQCSYFLDYKKAMLPHMQSWVIVLLKLLLATVTASGMNPPSANPSGFPGGPTGMLSGNSHTL
jgi:hypothetical protein